MLFLPRNNRLYAALLNVGPVYRYLATLLVLIGVSYGWFYGIYQPLQQTIQRHQTEIINLQSRYTDSKHLETTSSEQQTKVESLAKALQTYKRKTADDDAGFPLTAVMNLVEKNGLTLMHCRAQAIQDHDWYSAYPLALEAKGSLEHINKTLLACKNASLLLQPTHLTITKEGPDSVFFVFSSNLATSSKSSSSSTSL